jgi:integrase
VQRGLAVAIFVPRIYQHEGLPFGPTWEEVGRILTEASGNTPTQLRNHAILLLLAVYGLRSGEVRRFQIDDIDWSNERIRVVRSKSGLQETLPLEPGVGNAIARYLRHGRPQVDSRALFLTVLAPHRALSAGGLYAIVESHLSRVSALRRGRGPHGLRHACARHLINNGQTFKQVGDHLGHRSPDSTRIYAKVDLTSLRRVAFDDLGGLA